MTIPGTDIFLDPVVPAPLVLLLGLLLAASALWTGSKTAARLPTGRRVTLLVLRLLAIALVLLVLMQPSRIENIPSPIREKVTLVAVDTSASMRQTDSGKLSRLDAVRTLLWDTGLEPKQGVGVSGDVRLFEFSANATPITKPLNEINAQGTITHFDDSIRTMLGSLGPAQGTNGIFLLTDGHDFQLTNPSQTGLAARMRQAPIYAIPFGGAGIVRDLSVRITSYQPVYYVRQLIRINAAVRLLGCSYEKINVTLYREGKPLQRTSLVAKEEASLPVQFETTEPEPGQYEYEVKVEPVQGEVNSSNNSAATYANVLDKKIRVLMLEGEPYWDSTFLLRALRRNSKFDTDSVTQYAPGKVRVIRTGDSRAEFKTPESVADWSAYDVVVLGRGVDRILTAPQVDGLLAFIEKYGGAVVFSRADAFSGGPGDSLQPVTWKAPVPDSAGVLAAAKEGRGSAPTRLLSEPAAHSLPPAVGFYEAENPKTLTATLANGVAQAEYPAILHRRHGAGQVMSVGVDGLWRWAFNAQADPANPLFDKFWDQTILWLMSGRAVNPGQTYTFRADAANIPLGETIRFRVTARKADARMAPVPVTIEKEHTEAGRFACAQAAGDVSMLSGEFLPQTAGKYTAKAVLPDGTTQTARFFVFQDNEEETDVAADPAYLRRLCEASGGKVIAREEFSRMLTAAKEVPLQDTPRTRKIPLWDRLAFFWALGLIFGAEWHLRRRWGLC